MKTSGKSEKLRRVALAIAASANPQRAIDELRELIAKSPCGSE